MVVIASLIFLVDIGEILLHGEDGGRVGHHGGQEVLLLGPHFGIAHGRVLFVLGAVLLAGKRSTKRRRAAYVF